MLLYQILQYQIKSSICDKWKNMKMSYKNNKFKISAGTWNEEFELPDGSILHEIFNTII